VTVSRPRPLAYVKFKKERNWCLHTPNPPLFVSSSFFTTPPPCVIPSHSMCFIGGIPSPLSGGTQSATGGLSPALPLFQSPPSPPGGSGER